jgi:hypothetical protein
MRTPAAMAKPDRIRSACQTSRTALCTALAATITKEIVTVVATALRSLHPRVPPRDAKGGPTKTMLGRLFSSLRERLRGDNFLPTIRILNQRC